MNISIDRNENIVITTPDFPMGNAGNGDEIIKDSLDKFGVTEEGLVDNEIINNIEYKNGEVHYYNNDNRIFRCICRKRQRSNTLESRIELLLYRDNNNDEYEQNEDIFRGEELYVR